MSCLSFLPLILMPLSPGFDQSSALGRARGVFGDPGGGYAYGVAPMNHDVGTILAFPAGVGDRRYQVCITGVNPADGWLAYVTNKGGVIHREWAIRIYSTTETKLPPPAGTLERILADEGLRVGSPLPPAVRAALDARKPFTTYTCMLMASSIEYQFVDSNGKFSKVESAGYNQASGFWPLQDSGYPITREEKRWLKSHRNAKLK